MRLKMLSSTYKILLIFCIFVKFTFGRHATIINIKEDNWTSILEGEWMVEFMAPWCPACNAFSSTWEDLSKWSTDLDMHVGVVDVTESPGLSGRFFVTALPTIYHVKDGVFRQYFGPRKENDLVSFVDDRKWEQVEPVSWWLHPSSVQMSALGIFFKAAMVIRSFYTMLTETYGIPEWGCYLIFALLTIAIGLALGLAIVCCCDFLFPPKQFSSTAPRAQENALYDKKEDDESDLIDDTKQSEDGEPTKFKDDEDTTVRKRTARKTDQTE